MHTRAMRTPHLARSAFAACALLGTFCAPAHAGRIVINHDELTLSNIGFTQAGSSNATNFAQNVAEFLDTDGTAGGNILIYTNNSGLTGSNFSNALVLGGYTVTKSTAISFDLATLSGFDAVFLGGGGFGKNDTVLTNYVNAGGGVYVAAGTGFGGATNEAARWNGFLDDFGLAFKGASYNGFVGNDPVTGSHSIFAGVTQLFYNNGNTVLDIGNPDSEIVEFAASGLGLIGVFDDVETSVPGVPEPGSLALLGLGFAALAGLRRSHRREKQA